jgi:hypothetical protein
MHGQTMEKRGGIGKREARVEVPPIFQPRINTDRHGLRQKAFLANPKDLTIGELICFAETFPYPCPSAV